MLCSVCSLALCATRWASLYPSMPLLHCTGVSVPGSPTQPYHDLPEPATEPHRPRNAWIQSAAHHASHGRCGVAATHGGSFSVPVSLLLLATPRPGLGGGAGDLSGWLAGCGAVGRGRGFLVLGLCSAPRKMPQ
ncbi:hypothetical protein BC567DRAFT_85154 [Phyllosticta citribraziliensis]